MGKKQQQTSKKHTCHYNSTHKIHPDIATLVDWGIKHQFTCLLTHSQKFSVTFRGWGSFFLPQYMYFLSLFVWSHSHYVLPFQRLRERHLGTHTSVPITRGLLSCFIAFKSPKGNMISMPVYIKLSIYRRLLSIAWRHPSSSHCHNWLHQRSPKINCLN